MPFLSLRRGPVAVVFASVLLVPACTTDPTPPASGDPDGSSLVIGVAAEPTTLDPVAGYAPFGSAQVFDGLVEHAPGGALRPALATGLPTPAPDGRSWTVALRTDVSFTDGSAFDSGDVVATYRSVLAADAPLRGRFWMLSGVQAVDKTSVRFDLNAPWAQFPELLTLGVKSDGPPSDPPVGTGPYQVVSWTRGVSLELEANRAYFAGPPEITRVTLEFLPDDETRARRMREGRLDGAALPPTLAEEFAKTNGLAVVEHSSADLRAVSIPAGSTAADPAVLLALNLAVDRDALVRDALAGKGTAASQPVPEVAAEFVEPAAAFRRDTARAAEVLLAAGWVPGADGVRTRGGAVAAFDLAYPATDLVSRDLATAFAKSAAAVGVKVTPKPADATTDPATPRLTAFGDPFDPDRALYPLLHPGGGAVAAALDAERATTDPAQRAVAFRALQRAYAAAPTMVVLAAVDHTYVLRENWNGYRPVVDTTGTDHTWGPWWNLSTWTPR